MSRTTASRILRPDDWKRAKEAGEILPTPLDLRDGFLHLSPQSEVIKTAALHFSDARELVVISFNCEDLAPHLRWEVVPQREGQAFPHYYGRLSLLRSFTVSRLTRTALRTPWKFTEDEENEPQVSL